MREPSTSWTAFRRRGDLRPPDGPETGSRPDDDGRTPSTGVTRTDGLPQGWFGPAQGGATPSVQPPQGPLPAVAGALPDRRPAAGAVVLSAAHASPRGPGGPPPLTSVPERCRREILRALVQAAGRRQIAASDAAPTDQGDQCGKDDQADPDGAWRANAAAIAGRTCRYVAALQSSPGNRSPGRTPPVEQLAPFCGSCSSEAPTVEIAVIRPEREPAVVVHNGTAAPPAARALPPGPDHPATPRRGARGVVWWSLALSASAVLGGLAALLHDNPAGGSPRPGATTVDVPPRTATSSPTPTVGRTEGAGEATATDSAGTPPPVRGAPAGSRSPGGSARPSSTARLPAVSAPPTTGTRAPGPGAASEAAPNGSAEAPPAARTSPAPNATGTRRPSAQPPTGRPSAPTPGAGSESPGTVRPTVPTPGATGESPGTGRPSAPAPGPEDDSPVALRQPSSPSRSATPPASGLFSGGSGSTTA